jgi:hypothetical protein
LDATAFHFDPAFGHDSANPHDIGVVILPSKKTKGVSPLLLPTAGLLDQLAQQNGLKGEQFINVGYGGDVTATGQPIFAFDGIRQSSKSTFMALEANWLWLSMNAATGDGGDCFDDSGSPKLRVRDPNRVVALVVTGDAICRATTKDHRVDSPTSRAFLSGFVPLP